MTKENVRICTTFKISEGTSVTYEALLKEGFLFGEVFGTIAEKYVRKEEGGC